MASFVNAADAVAAAVEIEQRGRVFYRNAQAKAEQESVKEFFSFMAGEEQRHEALFSEMLKRIGGLPLPAGSTDEEYRMYVKNLLDSHALFLPGKEERALREPLLEAMRFEKDTLLFFLELEKMVPDSEKAHVRACADEERRHMRMLADRMAQENA